MSGSFGPFKGLQKDFKKVFSKFVDFVFLNFGLWTPDRSIFDLKFGFYRKKYARGLIPRFIWPF